MASVRVLVVPVSLLSVGETQLRVVTYRPGGKWLERPLSDATQARAVARDLLNRVLPDGDDFGDVRLERAGVWFEGEVPVVVLTAAVRMLPALADPAALDGEVHPDWPLLVPWAESGDGAQVDDEVRALLIAHWREQLERTTAAFDLLPRYFTTAQVRAIYSSVWGESQNDGNFHRWLHPKDKDQGIVKAAATDDVRLLVETELAERFRDLGSWMPAAMSMAAGMAGPRQAAAALLDKAVGVSPRRMGPMALAVPAIGVIGAVVGGVIAYQASKPAGKQPVWYERAHPERRPLASWYAPKPARLIERPVFIE